MHQLLRRLSGIMLLFTLLCGFFITTTSPAVAQVQSRIDECSAETTDDGRLDVTSIFNPSNFFPLIPAECGLDGEKVVALSFDTLPSVLIRSFGAIASLVFYLSSFYLVWAGVLYSYGGFDASKKADAIRKIQTAGIAIIMILSAYTITNTIVIVLGIGEYTNASVADFFVPAN